MSNEFTKKYFQPCVEKFVSTVLLIDDQLEYGKSPTLPSVENETLISPTQGTVMPHIEDETLDFSSPSDDWKRKVYVTDLIKTFSKEKLLVTPINPNEIGVEDKDECMEILTGLAEKADVIILDWEINVKVNDDVVFTGEELSIKIIEKLNHDDKYRLVIVYTANTKASVSGKIPDSKNIGIQIYGKTGATSIDVKEYDDLAKQIHIDFLSEKQGLLGAALLKSLTELRKSTYSMLNTLNAEYDEALMYHRILLTNPDKITEFCRDIIKDEILTHLEASAIEPYFDKTAFKEFIKTNNINIVVKETPGSEEGDISGETEILDTLLEKGYKSFFNSTTQALIANGENLSLLIHSSKEKIMQSFSYYSTMSFAENKPNLKLGCIVKNEDNYFLCIQPPCDSERIDKLKSSGKCKNPQNFLFLKLEKKDNNISFYVKENNVFQGLRLRYKMIETFLFAGNKDGFVSIDENGNYNTYSSDSTSVSLHFVCCLKTMFAQKIANNFAANISRVGIDQFEWLRLKGRE